MSALNWDEVLETTMQDEELAKDIASAFLSETQDVLKTLKKSIATQNVDEGKRAAHTIKGSLRMMAAIGQDTAKLLEELIPQEQWEACTPLATKLETELDSVYAEVNRRLA